MQQMMNIAVSSTCLAGIPIWAHQLAISRLLGAFLLICVVL